MIWPRGTGEKRMIYYYFDGCPRLCLGIMMRCRRDFELRQTLVSMLARLCLGMRMGARG